MRDFLNIVEGRTVLTEAPDYIQMFSRLFKLVASAPDVALDGKEDVTPEEQEHFRKLRLTNAQDEAQKEVNWAKSTLKRQDRIVWYLRIARARLLAQREGIGGMEAFKADVASYASKYDSSNVEGMILTAAKDRMLKHTLEHFMSMAEVIPQVQNIVFEWQTPYQLFNVMHEQEKVWREKRKGAIKHNDEDEVYIQFTDGFAWVLLDRASCEEEGDAMGHCGNRGSPKGGDRILSLRKPILIDGEKHWQPSLTFILKRDGMLGEMKGKGNEKPAERYHRYIISLLESDIVKGIVGGGYMPQNNFSMADLPEEEAERLMEKKPDLATFLFYYKKNGVDDVLIRKIDDAGFDFMGFDETKRFAKLKKFKDVHEFFEETGTHDAKYAVKLLTGEEEVNVHSYGSKDERENVWNDLDTAIQVSIGRYMVANHPDEVSMWEENEGEDYDPTNTSATLEIIEELDDAWVEALNGAYLAGQQTGTESEVWEAFQKRADDTWELCDGSTPGMLVFARDPSVKIEDYDPAKLQFDTECWLGAKTEDFMKLIGEMDAADIDYSGWLAEEPDIAQPHYGWSGYSEEAAQEHFTDNCPDFSKYEIAPEQAKAA